MPSRLWGDGGEGAFLNFKQRLQEREEGIGQREALARGTTF